MIAKKYKKFDRIRVDFDINTLADNVRARFDESHVIDFFKQAVVWHKNLSSEIFSFLLQEDNQK